MLSYAGVYKPALNCYWNELQTRKPEIFTYKLTNLPVICGVGIWYDVGEGGCLLARVAYQHVAWSVKAVLRHAHHVRVHVCSQIKTENNLEEC